MQVSSAISHIIRGSGQSCTTLPFPLLLEWFLLSTSSDRGHYYKMQFLVVSLWAGVTVNSSLLCIQPFLSPAPVACKNLLLGRLDFCKFSCSHISDQFYAFFFFFFLIAVSRSGAGLLTPLNLKSSLRSCLFIFGCTCRLLKTQVLLIYGTEALYLVMGV